jgi:RNA polymerase sigma-70 factor (ECF subfamily)
VTKSPNVNLSGEPAADRADYDVLVREAAGGDRQAMERLLMRAQAVAFRFSLLVCGKSDDAEDVMQEALLKTYRYVSRIKRPEAFRAWLFRTVRNACLLKRRKRVDEPAQVESLDSGSRLGDGGDGAAPVDVEDAAKRPDEIAINAWLGRRLRRALAALAPVDRMIVLLREIEGLSTREVADVTRMSEANVKTRLHRARVRLREHLEVGEAV